MSWFHCPSLYETEEVVVEMESEQEKKEIFCEVSDIKLIDFLNEDDFLVDHRFRDSLEDLRLSVTFRDISEHTKSFNKVAKTGSIEHQREEKLLNSGSFKPRSEDPLWERIKRDDAFCPGAGIPDVKKLSPVKEEFKRQESIISEDGSANSDFTFETFDDDAFFLDRLEDDIFEDVRASIYRSCGTPIFSSASRGSVAGKTAKLNVLSSKNVNLGSQKTKDSGANLKRQSPALRKSKAMTASPLQSQALQHIKGGYGLTPTGQTKRSSLGNGNVMNRKTGEGLMAHKTSASVDSPGFKSFLTPPTKSSYRNPSTATKGTKSPSFTRSSLDSSTISSKSLSRRGTRNTGTHSSKIASSAGSNSKPPLASSGSNSKPPLGYSARSRLSNQTSSIHLLTMSHQFNSSPASSNNKWSLQSSTSKATAKLISGNSRGKFKTETNKATGSDDFTQTKMLLDEHSKGAPTEGSPVPVTTPTSSKPSGLRMPSPKHGFFDDVTKSLSSFGETPKSSKPSGLRMPSPRHGFFDQEKFMVRSPLDTMQFRLSSPDAFSDPSANAYKRTNVPGNRKNFNSPVLTQSLHCTPVPRLRRSMHSKEIASISPLSTSIRTSMKTEEKRNKSMSKNKTGKEGKDQKARNGILLDPVKPVMKDHVEANHGLFLESDDQLLWESKENFEDQAKDLNIYFEVIDLEENATQLDGQKGNAGGHDGFSGGVHFLSGQQQDSPSISHIPLADINSACHESGSLQLSTESPAFGEVSTFSLSDGCKEENF